MTKARNNGGAESGAPRKRGMNRNRRGSVREMNGRVHVNFFYLGERVRESSGMPWNRENAATVRKQLDRIHAAIDAGTFRFAEVFPRSKKRERFARLEREVFGLALQPGDVKCGEYFREWYETLKGSGRVTERTLLAYGSLVRIYLEPYFSDKPFASINSGEMDRFYAWARKQRYKNKAVGNSTLNKCATLLKMVCKQASIEYGWHSHWNPFAGYRKLPCDDPYESIKPFSIEEQRKLIEAMPDHWKPYFKFAFASGLRQGEQIALKPEDIDWEKGVLRIQRAWTRDETGKPVMGKTKNRFSRRTIKLLSVMREALMEQREIHSRCGSPEFFFCSPTGNPIDKSNLRNQVWIPALNKAELEYREMKQTRHSFATHALGIGENPLWIAKVMGHRNIDMIVRVYGKFIENAGSEMDGSRFDSLYGVDGGKNGDAEFGHDLGKTAESEESVAFVSRVF